MAQVPVINNQFDIGGSLEDRLSKICYTSDSSYLLIGYSRSNISGDKTENSYGQSDYWIVKTNDNGNIDWQITLGGSLDDQAFAGEQTMDGGYIIGGTSYSGISGVKSELSKGSTDYWIVKLNSTGGIMWQKLLVEVVVTNYVQSMNYLMVLLLWVVTQNQEFQEIKMKRQKDYMIIGY